MRQPDRITPLQTAAMADAAPLAQGPAPTPAIAGSPPMRAQRGMAELLQRSPRMSAQHKEMAILSGQIAQQEEEEERPAQGKFDDPPKRPSAVTHK